MIIICEECGKKYRIDPSKIKGQQARLKCRSCEHIIVIKKPEEKPPESPPPVEPEPRIEREPEIPPPEVTPPEPEAPPEREERAPRVERRPPAVPSAKKFGLRLRGKMILLFFLIPVLLVAASGYLYLRQIDALASLITEESKALITKFAERNIIEKARSTAAQVSLYLKSHPDLSKEDFNNNMEFKRIAQQKVGHTGYTALYELPGSDNIWRTWVHPNSKIIGIDMSKLRKPLGKNFPGFWRIYTAVKGGRESSGYYTWMEKDGTFREKFMVCTPVEGTKFIVAATTYMDEFTLPLKRLERRAEVIKTGTRNMSLIILAVTLILIGVIVSVYGHTLAGKIKDLTTLADRISVGDLDTEISIKSSDELGELSDAISRMQESIRLSIERLRRRRR
jgi:predicted Zn finger-like uncharacterized protein